MDEISLCRLCQNENGVYCLKKEKTLLNWVEKYVQVKVSDDPVVLPNLLCISCKTKIFKFHSYVLYCHEINEQLQNTVEIAKLDEELSLSLYGMKNKNDKSNRDPLLITDDVQDVVTDDEKYEEIIYLDESDVDINIKPQSSKENQSIEDILEEPSLDRNDEEYPCKLCSEKFTLRRKLKEHIRTIHVNEIDSFEHSSGIDMLLCSFCGKGYTTKYNLRVHENQHKGIRLHPCELCDKSFYDNFSLKRHKRIDHLNEKLLCSKCCRPFKSRSALQRHEIVHTGIKNFICKTCSKAFFTKRELLIHNRSHSELRPYKCSVCYKCFNHRNYLTVHERIHSEQRPYPCSKPACKRQFVTQYKLNLHMKTHTKKELKLKK